MDDDELAVLRQAALQTLKKTATTSSPPANRSNGYSNRQPDHHRDYQRMGDSGPSWRPNPSYNANKHFRPGNNHFVKNFSQRTNLVVLHAPQGDQRREETRPFYSSQPEPTHNSHHGFQPRCSSQRSEPEVVRERVLPGRFARLNDDSSDSDEDDRLDDVDSIHGDNESTTTRSPFIEDNSLSNADFDHLPADQIIDPENPEDEVIPSANDNKSESSDSESSSDDISERTTSARNGFQRTSDVPVKSPVREREHKLPAVEEQRPQKPKVNSPVKESSHSKYARKVNGDASTNTATSETTQDSDQRKMPTKIKLVVDKSEDLAAKRRQKFGVVTPPVSESKTQSNRQPERRLDQDVESEKNCIRPQRESIFSRNRVGGRVNSREMSPIRHRSGAPTRRRSNGQRNSKRDGFEDELEMESQESSKKLRSLVTVMKVAH